MSERDDRIDGVARAVLMAIMLSLFLAAMNLIQHELDQSEIRDLQRRMGQLEQQR